MKTNSHAPTLVTDWRSKLILSQNLSPKPLLANAATAFRYSQQWQGLLSFDAFHNRTMLRGQPPWGIASDDRPWAEPDDYRAAEWMQHQGIAVSPDTTSQAIEMVARENSFHPVVDYLRRCRWDTESPLLDEWAIRFLGAEDTPYIRAISCRFMISAVARVHQPGCKADCIMILEGPQGARKSTALRTLFHPWFTDELAELGTKDAAIQLAGAWGIEMSELDSMRRGDVSRIKAFLSRTTDRYRPPYGRRVVEQPRQCAFTGSINDNEYLRDETGARRFWPLPCGKINIEGIIANRDALWAEARDRYFLDEPWWLETPILNELAATQQSSRRVLDPWQEKISDFITAKTSVTASEYLAHIGMPDKDQTQLDQNRVVACLKALGWCKKSMRVPDYTTPRWRYVPKTF